MSDLKPKSVPLPKILWDELENVFMIKSKELVNDIAKTLRQDPQILWKEFRAKKASVFLLDNEQEEDNYECIALVANTKVAHKCRKPRAYGQLYCPEHEFFTMTNELKNKPQLQRVTTEEGTYFLDCLTQQVYTVDYERVGFVTNEKCFVFEIEESMT